MTNLSSCAGTVLNLCWHRAVLACAAAPLSRREGAQAQAQVTLTLVGSPGTPYPAQVHKLTGEASC